MFSCMKLYRIQLKTEGVWRDQTTTTITGNEAFQSLISRVRNGEIDPRANLDLICANGEGVWRLVEL
jgi:hypothetical protein